MSSTTEVTVMVVEVAARRQRRPATAEGGVVTGTFDGGCSVAAFDGGNRLRQGDGEREMLFDCGGGGW